MSLRFTLDGNEIAPPQNWKELEVELNFDSGRDRLTSTDFEFLGSTATTINQWIEDGCNGGVGLLEPPVFNVDEICEDGVFNVLNSILKLDEAEFACDWTKTPVQELGSLDFLEGSAESFSFWYLAQLSDGEAGKISPSDYVELFYSTKDVPDGATLALLSVTIFTVIKELVYCIKNIVDTIGSATQYPLLGEVILQLIALSVYATILTIELIVLTKQVFDALVPKPRKHSGMKVVTLMEKACEYLGYKFSSTIFYGDYNNLVIIPEKQKEGNLVTSLKIQEGVYDGTFAQLIDQINFQFNTKVTLIGDTLHLERWDYFKNQSTYQLPEVKKEFNGTNANELNYNFFYEYSTDAADLKSFEGYSKGVYSQTVVPNITNQNGNIVPFTSSVDKRNLLLKGLDSRTFPFGQVDRRSDCENDLEKILLFVSDVGFNVSAILNNVANNTIGQLFPDLAENFSLGGSSEPQPVIACRIGFAEFQTSFLGVQRMYMMDEVNDNLVAEDSRSILSPKTLFNSFHYINSPIGIGDNTEGNQWRTYNDLTIPFTCEDFQEIKEQGHNYIKINDKGTTLDAKLKSLRFNPFNCTANVSLMMQKKFTCNLKEDDEEKDTLSVSDIFAAMAFGLSDSFSFIQDNPFEEIGEQFNDFTNQLEDWIRDTFGLP